MLDRLGRLAYRARWTVVAVWLLIFAVAVIFAPRVSSVLHGGGYTIGNSQSIDAYNLLHRTFGYRALTFTAVFTGERQLLQPEALKFRRQATQRFGSTLSVQQPVWTPDHQVVFERVFSAPQEDFGAGYSAVLRGMLPHGAVQGQLTGSSAIFHDMEIVSNEDLQRVETVTLPLAALVLLIIFGSLVAATTPVVMAPVAVTLALASVYLLGHRLDMSIFVLNTASMLGLGVAIDYSLFMVNRFREELAGGSDLESAVGRTVATSGRAILVSALVVSIGFFSLTLMGVSMLRSIGIGGGIVTAFSLVVSITFLPALLGILGHRINRLPVLPTRLSTRRAWGALAHWVMRRPVLIVVVVMAVIAVLAWPAFHLRVGIPGAQILPSSVESRSGNDVLDRHLGIANHQPVLVVLQRLPGTPVSTARATAFVVLDRICSSREVLGLASVPIPDSPTQVASCDQTMSAYGPSRAGRSPVQGKSLELISVFLHSDVSSAAAEQYVQFLRSQPPIPGYRVLIGGQTAGQMDFDNFLYAKFPWVVLFVIVTIYVILLVAFRSLLLPLKAVLMNLFSILAAYGAVVYVFQDGHLAGLFGFTPAGNVDSIVPIFLFSVLFGISTDYEVFLLSRVQEEYARTGNNEESVATGLEITGRIITSAAAVMIVVFAAFAFARLLVIKELGLGMAFAVLIDATLIRALLVPATMRILGRWNWWLPVRGFPTTGADIPAALADRAAG